jgi:hypothetical protein
MRRIPPDVYYHCACRWRTLRKTWTRRLRQADSTREAAVCISEFHDNLKTDKSSGTFAAGGPWELSLRECLSGEPAAAAASQFGLVLYPLCSRSNERV